MEDRRLTLAPLREAGRSVLARSGKLLFGLGMAATLPQTAATARKDKDAQNRDESRKEERRDAKSEDGGRDGQNKSDASAEETEKSDTRSEDDNQNDTDHAERSARREDRSDNRDHSANQESSGEERRSVTRKQDTASDDAADDDDDGHRGGRRTEELAQDRGRDDEPNVDDTPDDVPATPAVPSNPTIPVPTTPDATDADLFIQSNPDVVANVSTNGGFAFARSGNVIAVSGPDGAQIIQTDNPEAVVTPTPSPGVPPSDGGNNDMDFSS